MAQALDYDLGSGPMISKDGAGGENRNIHGY